MTVGSTPSGAYQSGLSHPLTSRKYAPRAGVFTVPGDGSIDFVAVLAELARAGYEGWLVVEAEQDPAIAHPLTYARKGHAALSAAAVKAGLQLSPP